MSTTTKTQETVQRPSSWRDKLFAEYEISQARLRILLAEETHCQEEFL